jgi:hypothetical protein
MDNTNVDEMLIKMIEPKIKEIEEKFSYNQGLNDVDIYTLLLKSKYNQINHLDMKLNEVTADVASLKDDIKSMKGEFNLLKADFQILDVNLQKNMQETINNNMQWSIGLIALLVTELKLIDVIFGKG